MNKKLTKLLSIFLIAGAVGAGAAGIAGCTDTPHTHDFAYEDAGNGKHHVTCTGCDETFDDEDHNMSDDLCGICGYADFDEVDHEVATHECDFQDPVIVGIIGNNKTPSTITLGGKFTIAPGVYLEADGIPTSNGKGNIDTQKARISFTLTGDNGWNYVSFKAKIATDGVTSATVKLCKKGGTVVKSLKLGTDLATFSAGFDFVNKKGGDMTLPAGDYYIECTDASLKIGDLKVQEYVDKSPIVSLRAVPAKTQYVQGTAIDESKLSVVGIKRNNAEVTLKVDEYTTDASTIDMTTPGEKTITVTYTPAEGEPVTTTYKVTVVGVTGVSVNSEFMQKVYIKSPTATLDKSNLCVYIQLGGNANDTQKVTNFTATGYDLNTVGEQNVTISYGENLSTTVKITVIESAIQAVNGIATVNVDAASTAAEGTEVSGVRTFKSLKNAIKYLEISNLDADVNKVVNVKAGTYEEMISTNLSNLTLVGKGTTRDDTVLTYKVVEGDKNPVTGTVWGLSAATLAVTGTGFKAYNISIRNDFDYIKDHGKYSGNQAAQGLALSIGGDRAVLYNCHLFGNQDTLYLKAGRAYFYETQIDGNIDFIFGNENGLAYFEKCTIKAISRNGGAQEGYVTAMKGDRTGKYAEYGYIFNDCTFTDDGKCQEGSMSLGRTWGKNPSIAIINSKLSKVYSKLAYGTSGAKLTRYCSMNGTPVNAYFVEYNNEGIAADNNGAITASVAGCTVMDNATNYTKANIFAATNGSVTWAADWNCDTDLSNLKILAGLEEGEISKDPTKTVSFNGIATTTDLDTHINGLFTYTGGTPYWNAKSGVADGICIPSGTVIEFETPGRVAIEWYSNSTYGNPTHVVLEYIEGGKCKITALQQTYIYGITLNTADVPAKSTSYTITYKYNDENATPDNTATTVIEGNYLKKPTDPNRSGYSFVAWHVDTADGAVYNFDSAITANLTLVAEWQVGVAEHQAGVLIDISAITQIYQAGTDTTTGMEQGVTLDATATGAKIQANGDNIFFNDGAKIKVKVAEGLTVLPVWHNATTMGNYTVSARDADGYVTITAGSGTNYLMKIMVIQAYIPASGETIALNDMRTTVQNHYADNGTIVIDAKASGAKFDYKSDQGGYVQVNVGTVIKIKVSDGATLADLNVSMTAYNGNPITVSDAYDMEVVGGYLVLTCKVANGGYPRSITIA